MFTKATDRLNIPNLYQYCCRIALNLCAGCKRRALASRIVTAKSN